MRGSVPAGMALRRIASSPHAQDAHGRAGRRHVRSGDRWRAVRAQPVKGRACGSWIRSGSCSERSDGYRAGRVFRIERPRLFRRCEAPSTGTARRRGCRVRVLSAFRLCEPRGWRSGRGPTGRTIGAASRRQTSSTHVTSPPCRFVSSPAAALRRRIRITRLVWRS